MCRVDELLPHDRVLDFPVDYAVFFFSSVVVLVLLVEDLEVVLEFFDVTTSVFHLVPTPGD